MLLIPCHSIRNHGLLECPTSEANVVYNIHNQFDSHAPLYSQGRSTQNGWWVDIYIIISTDMYSVFLGRLTKCNSLDGMEQEVSYNEIGKKNHKLI
jgi:hypothetical protein